MKITIVSNGHGEDIIGAALAGEFRLLGYGVQAVPLVGKGLAYERAGFTVLGPRKEMPSGGFAIQSPAAIWADVRAGWFSMSVGHYQAVRAAARASVATLVVGDIYGILVGSVFGKRPLFQMQCLVSVRAWEAGQGGNPYGVLERSLMRRAVRVYPRELEAAQWLQANGVSNAQYLGNPMLDALDGVPLELSPPYLLLLPGSRSDAYESLPKMLEACRLLRDTGLTPVVGWAGLPVEMRVEGGGWRVERTGEKEGITHHFVHSDGTAVYLSQGAFKACILGAKVAISTSGTAAEQAAGYGVAVVGFPTAGPQYTLPFAQNQKRLLGDALMLVEANPEAIARAVRRFLSGELREKARAAGKAAMGEPGAAKRIAEDVHLQLRGVNPV